MSDDSDLVALLRDVCRLCEARSATLAVGGAVRATWPATAERGRVEIASTRFETPGGAHAELRLFARVARALTPMQQQLLFAYAAHARVTLL